MWKIKFGSGSLFAVAANLISSTVLTTGLGFLFWILAAREFTVTEVGIASASISSMILLANIGQLGMTSVLIRFLPIAGSRAGRFTGVVYSSTIGLSIILAIGFIALGFAKSIAGHSPLFEFAFVLSVPLWTVFIIQDSVLVAIKRSWIVPVENTLFALAKMALLFVMSLVPLALNQLFSAWTLPVLPTTLIVSIVIVRHFRTSGLSRPLTDEPFPALKQLASAIGSEISVSSAGLIVAQLMPVIVAVSLGARDTAYFYLPWMIRNGVINVLSNLTTAYIASSLHRSGNDGKRASSVIKLLALVSIGSAAFILIFAPELMALFSSSYTNQPVTLLRLIAVAFPFTAANFFYFTKLWLEKKFWVLSAIQMIRSAALLVLTEVFIHRYGIVSIGYSLLAVEIIGSVFSIRPIIEALKEQNSDAPAVPEQPDDYLQ